MRSHQAAQVSELLFTSIKKNKKQTHTSREPVFRRGERKVLLFVSLVPMVLSDTFVSATRFRGEPDSGQ